MTELHSNQSVIQEIHGLKASIIIFQEEIDIHYVIEKLELIEALVTERRKC